MPTIKNDELKLTIEKLIMDEPPLSSAKEIVYKTVIQMLEEELASTKQELANYKKMVYGQKSEKSEIILKGSDQMSILTKPKITPIRKSASEKRTSPFRNTKESPREPMRKPLRIFP